MARRKKPEAGVVTISLAIAVVSLAAGLYIQHRLNQYASPLHVFASREISWRDQAFGVAKWAALVALGLIVLRWIARRIASALFG